MMPVSCWNVGIIRLPLIRGCQQERKMERKRGQKCQKKETTKKKNCFKVRLIYKKVLKFGIRVFAATNKATWKAVCKIWQLFRWRTNGFVIHCKRAIYEGKEEDSICCWWKMVSNCSPFSVLSSAYSTVGTISYYTGRYKGEEAVFRLE